MPSLGAKAFSKASKEAAKRGPPVWKGPQVDGVTNSLLQRFLVCPERFRILVIEGLRGAEGFNHKIEYGNLWHTCEEVWEQGGDWPKALTDHAKRLAVRYKEWSREVDKWYNVCKVQFPVYLDHWKDHPREKNKVALFSEQVFKVPIKLPSGTVVFLRGKWDGGYALPLASKKARGHELFLKENKTKGDVDVAKLERQLRNDMQTMIYLTALWEYYGNAKAGDPILKMDYGPPVGVLYNVVRRPLSGGRGNIKQLQPTKKNPRGESSAEYYARLGRVLRVIDDEDPKYMFYRNTVRVSLAEIETFKRRTLFPLLERLCIWYNWVSHCWQENMDPFDPERGQGVDGLHWQYPYGVRNMLDEGVESEVDPYMVDGNAAGLRRTENLFPELTP